MEDPGSGYDGGKVVPLIIGPPNRGGLQATATVGWDYAVGGLVESGGSGFNESGTSRNDTGGRQGQAKAIATLTKATAAASISKEVTSTAIRLITIEVATCGFGADSERGKIRHTRSGSLRV